MKNDFEAIASPALLLNCECCGAESGLWKDRTNVGCLEFFVSCSRSDPICEGDSIAFGGCPQSAERRAMYRATKREAVNIWNEFQRAIRQLREDNGKA